MADLGDFGLGQELDCFGFVGGHNRRGGVPVKVREVRVCGVLGVGEEGSEDVGALVYRGALHGCGNVETDDRGRILCGQARELGQCRDAGLSGFAEELAGPGAQHRFAILEQGKEIALGQAVDDVQTPQGAQALGRGAG